MTSPTQPEQPRRTRYAEPAAVALCAMLVLLAVALFKGEADPASSERSITDMLPNDLHPELHQLLGQGDPVVVNIWAAWCAPCRAEHPVLIDIASRGVPIYGINYVDDPQKAAAFLEELGSPFVATVADPDGQLTRNFGLTGVPETVLVRSDGSIAKHHIGPITIDMWTREFEPLIETLSVTGEAAFEQLLQELQCPNCVGSSVGESPSPLAQAMRREIRDALKAGDSPQVIRDRMIDRYGARITSRPPLEYWWTYAIPVLLLAACGFWLSRRLAKRRSA